MIKKVLSYNSRLTMIKYHQLLILNVNSNYRQYIHIDFQHLTSDEMTYQAHNLIFRNMSLEIKHKKKKMKMKLIIKVFTKYFIC